MQFCPNLLPCLSGILRTHIAQKSDVEQLPLLRMNDRVGVATPDTGRSHKCVCQASPFSCICVSPTTRVSDIDTPSKTAAYAPDKVTETAAAKINPRTMAPRSYLGGVVGQATRSVNRADTEEFTEKPPKRVGHRSVRDPCDGGSNHANCRSPASTPTSLATTRR